MATCLAAASALTQSEGALNSTSPWAFLARRQSATSRTHWAIASCLALACVLTCARTSVGDIVYREGAPGPLIGNIIDSNDNQIVLRFTTPVQGVKQVTVPRAEIITIIETVSTERLSELKDGDWTAYRDYAEELAPRTLDPAAHELAIRLYLIVAYHTDGDIRRGAMRALIQLARTPTEERRLRTLAYLEDKAHNPELLSSPQEFAPVKVISPEMRDQLLTCLRLARQGYRDQAITLARRPDVREGFEAIAHLVSFRDFQTAAYDTNIAPERLSRLIRTELALLGVGDEPDSRTKSDALAPGWSQLVAQGVGTPFKSVDWNNVTEFDPQRTVYRNGTWELP